MEKLLIINPGSTSTKIAVYEDEKALFVESISHSSEELAPFENVVDQYAFREKLILETMEKHGVTVDDLVKWNGEQIKDPNLILIGQELIVGPYRTEEEIITDRIG